MQSDEGGVHQDGGEYRLHDADDGGLPSRLFEGVQTEFVADGEGDKAQRHVAEQLIVAEILGGKAQMQVGVGKVDLPQQIGTHQNTRHQIGGDGGQFDQLCRAGEHQAGQQRHRQT